MSRAKILAPFVVVAALGAPAAAQAPDFVYLPLEDVPFKSALGTGPQQAVIFGDPSKPGVYVVRVKFPPGFHSWPHFHSQDRHAVVVKGTWWNGQGDKLDFRTARPVTAGSYVFHPAGKVHWDGAGEEETVIQITGIGPVETTQVGKPDPENAHWPSPK